MRPLLEGLNSRVVKTACGEFPLNDDPRGNCPWAVLNLHKWSNSVFKLPIGEFPRGG